MGAMRDEMMKVAAELNTEPSVETKIAPKVEPKVETKTEPKAEPKVEPKKELAPKTDKAVTEPKATTIPVESDDPLPEGWADDRKESWKTLPKDLREYLKKREKERNDGLTSKMQEADKVKKQFEKYSSIPTLFDPVREQLALQGVDEATYMRNLINAHMAINKDPKSALRMLAKQYGLDPAELIEAAAQNPELAERDKRIAALEARFQQQGQASEVQLQTQVKTAIQAFQEEKDAQGNSAHPHFEKVRVAMGALMSSGQAKDLKDAYDRAVFVDPELRETMLQERVKSALAAKETEDAEKAKAAKAAGLNVKGSNAPNVAAEKAKTWKEAFKQTAQDLRN